MHKYNLKLTSKSVCMIWKYIFERSLKTNSSFAWMSKILQDFELIFWAQGNAK